MGKIRHAWGGWPFAATCTIRPVLGHRLAPEHRGLAWRPVRRARHPIALANLALGLTGGGVLLFAIGSLSCDGVGQAPPAGAAPRGEVRDGIDLLVPVNRQPLADVAPEPPLDLGGGTR